MIVTAVVALSLGGIVGGIVGGSGNGTATTAEPNPTVTVTEVTAEAKPASKAPSPKKTTEPEPKSTISDGVHEVGVDVKAGQYKTNVPEGEFCYWKRSRGEDDISDSTEELERRPRSPIGNAQERRVFHDRGLRHVEKGLTALSTWER